MMSSTGGNLRASLQRENRRARVPHNCVLQRTSLRSAAEDAIRYPNTWPAKNQGLSDAVFEKRSEVPDPNLRSGAAAASTLRGQTWS